MTQYTAPDHHPLKVVFLDIDGVLVTCESVKRRHPDFRWNRFHPPCVEALNDITNQTGAVIVISSTWRVGGPKWWARLVLYLHLEGVTAPVVGQTPIISGRQRGDEIAQWIAEQGPISKFVVFDDDSDMDAVCKHHLKTGMKDGLTQRHIPHALKLLGWRPDNEEEV